MTLAIVCAALVGGLLGSGVASAQATPDRQSAVSPFFGAITGFPFFGSFNAVSDAGGANPSGQVSYQVGGPTSGYQVSGTVVCLSVSGNTAVIGFEGTINRPLIPPEAVVGELVVADNGPADSDLDTVGASERDPATGPPSCSTPGTVQARQVLGDVIVHAAALPAAKEQCKNGGWRNFGSTFRNQGQCVAFVGRGPKP